MPLIHKTLWLVKEAVVVDGGGGGGGGGGAKYYGHNKMIPPPSPNLALQAQRCFLRCPVCMFVIVIL